MARHYIIDGNNLIGKVKRLWKLQQKDGQASREQLAFILDRHFSGKPVSVTLHFDGFKGEAIKTNKLRIEYSNNKTADEEIKKEIARCDNPKMVGVISSDRNVMEFAHVNACEVIKCEDFVRQIKSKNKKDEEAEKVKSISNDEMKRLFGVE